MRSFAAVFFVFLFLAGVTTAEAQVVASATRGTISLTAGGVGSVFQPDYAGNGVPEAASNRLYGGGVFVDVKFTHWIQVEGEGRWLRLNPYLDITEDNYLVGPRFPIHDFALLHATPYAKVLVGVGKMTFENNYAYGRFFDIAYGGGVDLKVTKRLSIRAIDFEYQMWPNWVNGTLKPYGASVGVGYKVF